MKAPGIGPARATHHCRGRMTQSGATRTCFVPPMPSELLTERDGPTLVLTLHGPETRNTLSEGLIAAGIEALGTAEGERDVRAIVLTGAGGHFCAGGNLQGLMARREAGREAQARMLELLHRWIEALRGCPKPVIAAVEGAAAGAGFSLALACDLVVASEEARFMLSYAKLGLSPDGGATWHLGRALPRALVQQLVWHAEPVSARQLEQHGVVNHVSAAGQALADAKALSARLAKMAPNAIASGKDLLQRVAGATFSSQLAAERDHFIENLFHPNAGEGIAAFLGKRAPRFE
jgi:enoyl-CoA hydratase/carnithine racemase